LTSFGENLRERRVDLAIIALIIVLFSIGCQRAFLGDTIHYQRMVEVFRGNGNLGDVPVAFRNRILTPLIASFLPFGPRWSMQIVNLFFGVMTGLLLVRYFKRLGSSAQNAFLGVILFFLSASYFVYGTQPLTDMSAMFFIVLALYGLLEEWGYGYVMAVILIGVLSRETILFLVPIFYVVLLKRYRTHRIAIILIGAVPIVGVVFTRYLISASIGVSSSGLSDVWIPNMSSVTSNLNRLIDFQNLSGASANVYLTLLPFLPFAISSLIGRKLQKKVRSSERRFLLYVGIFLALTTIYGLSSAYFDGRFVWVLFPVIVPLALFEYERWEMLPVFGRIKSVCDKILVTLVGSK
jgi:hypothetical protein